MEHIQQKKTICLKEFKSALKYCKFFQEPTGELPEFLNQNLIDQARCIKIFRNDNEAYLKIFYFQFLKICFQCQDIDYTTKINKFIAIIEQQTNLLKLSPKFMHHGLSGQILKDILFQFLQLLGECKQSLQKTLARYPAIGDIIVNFLAAHSTKFQNICPQQYNTIKCIKALSNFFLVDFVQYDNCIQFNDAQVYLYQQSQNEIYMIYIDQTKALRNTKIDSNTDEKFYVFSSKSLESGYQCETIKFQGTEMVFGDNYTSSSGQFFQQKYKIQLKTACTFNNTDQSFIGDGQNKQQKLKYNSQQNFEFKRNPKFINVTQEFTNTFILDNFISEPCRTKIKVIKSKMRQQRKTIKPFIFV